ncbi:putative tail protein [Pseudomonas phage PPpW-3]|uniref:Putative tail protein n=1 Tax=Pseudomonas phage PPpW-3 TaxID=1279082 RepID=V5YUN9_9CAUD|nr:tail length tape measure protein [Pseudomonas phage PPpW-3]BAO20621.1 putative tail protein [Pseudomonas phage PPpW-3]
MANKRLNATIQIGGAVASSLRSAFGDIKGQVGQVGAALRRLETEQRLLTTSIKTFGEMGKNVDGLRARYVTLTAQVDKLRAAHERLRSVQDAQQANAQRRADLRGQMFDAVALGATAATPIVKAAQFETAMLGVAKQVEGARDANGQLTQVYYDMGKAIQQLGREVPLATNELADMVTAGSRMGVAKDDILEFTRTAAMMADAFELPAGELADNMGKIAGLYKIPIPAIGELADAVNFLDDNAISKGSDIIDFLTRTGGAASAVKIGGKDMAALGSTLLTLGERAETASTATNAMFAKFAAADKGTKKFHAAMKQIGLSTAEVQKGMQVDAGQTILKVMDAIGKLPKEDQLGVMVELVGLEHADTMAKLANNTEEFRKQLEMANSAAAKGSMSREFQARLQTTNAQWQIMKNRVEELAVNFGSVLLPAVNDVFGAIAPVVSTMADFAREHPAVTKAVVGTAVALATLRVSTLAAQYAFTFLKGGALQVAATMAKLRAGMVMASISMPGVAAGIRAIGMAFISTGVGALVVGLAVAGTLIYKHWDGVQAFMTGILDGLRAGLQPVVQTFSDFWQALQPISPLFGKIGSAVQTAWQWFTSLLGPVQYTQDELGKAGAAGKSFGEALAAGINFVLTPLQTLISGLTWVANNIGVISDKAVAFKNAVGDKVGGAWQATKEFFGAGDEPAAAAAGAGAPALPQPAMATGKGQAGSYTDNSQNSIKIVQQPGENNKDLARRVIEEQERQRAIRQRSAMTDGATAQ